MNSTKILFAVAFIAFCCITISTSQRCFVCDSKESCNRPRLTNCTTELAIVTRSYLDAFHSGINVATTSPNFECFHQDLTLAVGDFFYRGCTFQNIPGCNYPLRDFFMLGRYERYCNQCSNRDGCNPANRIDINMKTIIVTIAIAFMLRYVRWC